MLADDKWKDSYDQWKLASPDDYYCDEPEEPCDCIDYDQDWEGRCTCGRCGRIWYKTAADMQADAEREAAFVRYVRREAWKARLLGPWHVVRGWFPRKRPDPDDDIPF